MELREKISNILCKEMCYEDWPCHTTWCKLPGHQNWATTEALLALFKEAGWKSPDELKGMVPLDPDPSLPENPYETDVHLDHGIYDGLYRKRYSEAQQAMLKAGWRKVKP